jgi:hypothetical protein
MVCCMHSLLHDIGSACALLLLLSCWCVAFCASAASCSQPAGAPRAGSCLHRSSSSSTAEVLCNQLGVLCVWCGVYHTCTLRCFGCGARMPGTTGSMPTCCCMRFRMKDAIVAGLFNLLIVSLRSLHFGSAFSGFSLACMCTQL